MTTSIDNLLSVRVDVIWLLAEGVSVFSEDFGHFVAWILDFLSLMFCVWVGVVVPFRNLGIEVDFNLGAGRSEFVSALSGCLFSGATCCDAFSCRLLSWLLHVGLQELGLVEDAPPDGALNQEVLRLVPKISQSNHLFLFSNYTNQNALRLKID